MITKYGYDVVVVVLLLVLAGSLVSWFLIDARAFKYPLIGGLLLLLAFTLYFFRDPDRKSPAGENLVIAPADGKVIAIQEVRVDEFLKSDAVQISIFMSPLNVHVNRFPISGTIGYFRHFPGEYLMAFDEKSSVRNERTQIGIERENVRVLFKQIAGFLARRIVADLKVGDRAVAGERFGMIKFGSRVDILLPRSTDIKVRPGQLTVAGETVLGELR